MDRKLKIGHTNQDLFCIPSSIKTHIFLLKKLINILKLKVSDNTALKDKQVCL